MAGLIVYQFKNHPILCKALSDAHGVEVIAVDSMTVKHEGIDIDIGILNNVFGSEGDPSPQLTNAIILDMFDVCDLLGFFPSATHIFLLDFIHVETITSPNNPSRELFGLRIGSHTKKMPKIIRVPT